MILKSNNYRAGYLLTPKSLDVQELSEADYLEIGNHKLYYSQNQAVNTIENNNGMAVLLGYAFDIRYPGLNENEILENLIATSDVVEELEYINGRYFVILQKNNTIILYSDASQLKPLVYHSESKVLASHDGMIQDILLDNGYKLERRSEFNHNELDFTRYNEIFKFNPSLSLDLKTFEFERIYPRSELIERTPEYTFNKMKTYLDNSIEWLKKNDQYKFLSMTGGIDSRVSAALTRSLSDDIEYMTYTRSQKNLKTELAKLIYSNDDKITKQMQQNMAWNHTIFNLDDYEPSESAKEENDRILYSNHSYKLANYYKNQRKFKNAFHIKSTVFGMGKADFPVELDQKSDDFVFYKKCIHGLSLAFKKLYNLDEEAPKYFERNLVTEGVTLNRHYFDLFHLESRMGNWHSALTLETDPGTEEFIFTNSRKIIDLIQQPSLEERKEFILYKIIIDHYWPLLLHFGINNYHEIGLEFLKSLKDKVEVKNNIFVEYKPSESILEKQKNKFYIQPNDDKAYASKNYEFFVSNKNKSGKLGFKSTYTNENGRGKIKVVIRGHEIFQEYDILDLNKEVNFDFNDQPVLITITYDKDYKNASWQKAARLYCIFK